MATGETTCDRRDRCGKVVYTGVNQDRELRDCPGCACEVAVDPDAGEVLHVEAE